MMELKPYPEYKDSCVSWVPELPIHWECHKGKWLFQKMDRPIRPEDEVVTCFRDGMVTLRKYRRTRGFTESIQEIGYQGIRKDDLVIHAMDAFAGAIGVSDSDGKGSPVYSVCQPKMDINVYYYAYITREMARSKYILSLAKGIRERSTDFRFIAFASQLFPVPPKEEQEQIACFLDYQVHQFSRFIRAKQRLIKLLNEQKQVIINQAVTKGINPNVKLKPSGVDYLGDIPEHWEVRRLRTIATVKASNVDKKSNEGEIPIRLCNYVDVYKSDFINDKFNFMKATATPEEISKFELAAGDIIITKDSESWDDIAVPAYVPVKLPGVICAYHLCLIKPHLIEIDAEFLFRAFCSDSVANQFRVTANGVTRFGLSHGAIKKAFFPVPPKTEQKMIVDHINRMTIELAAAISRTEREIALIREYQTRLIVDVVTGKVDVRDVPVELITDSEIEELLPADDIEELEGVVDD